jgi:hypothetical protein
MNTWAKPKVVFVARNVIVPAATRFWPSTGRQPSTPGICSSDTATAPVALDARVATKV